MDFEEREIMRYFGVFLLGMAVMYLWLMANGQIVALP